MAIIVDKVQKRKDIAMACRELFYKNGINDLTISKIAKFAGVGKGTIYEYFKNKEDIVFEIVNILMKEHNIAKEKNIAKVSSTKDKIKVFFEFFYNDDADELRQIYKEFISISLMNRVDYMIEFQTNCFNRYNAWLKEIIQDGIDKKELKPLSIKLTNGLFVLGDGIFIASSVTDAITDVKKEIDDYIDTLFELMEV